MEENQRQTGELSWVRPAQGGNKKSPPEKTSPGNTRGEGTYGKTTGREEFHSSVA